MRAVVELGAVGINLEGASGHTGTALLAPEIQAERIRAARAEAVAAGGDLFIAGNGPAGRRRDGRP